MSRYSHLYANTEQDLRVIAEMDAEAAQADRAERRRIAADTLWPEAIQAEVDRIPPAPGKGGTILLPRGGNPCDAAMVADGSARRVRWVPLLVGVLLIALFCVGWSAVG